MVIRRFLHLGLQGLHYSGVAGVFRRFFRGQGAILTLHRVLDPSSPGSFFKKNAALEIRSDFLEEIIVFLRKNGYRIVSLQQALAEIASNNKGPPFVVFTLDDGYLDNYTVAWPIFKKYACPFTVFVTTSVIDGDCELWWFGLEEVLKKASSLAAFSPFPEVAKLGGAIQRERVFGVFYKILWALPQHTQRSVVRDFCLQHGVNLDHLCRNIAMTWDQVREMAQDPLCEIGAHTERHFALSLLPLSEAEQDMRGSLVRIEHELGKPVASFAYPYGHCGACGPREYELAKALGLACALTTQKGVLFPKQRSKLFALPRLPVNGLMQDLPTLSSLLSGIPTAFR